MVLMARRQPTAAKAPASSASSSASDVFKHFQNAVAYSKNWVFIRGNADRLKATELK